jgi:hypothetical protein
LAGEPEVRQEPDVWKKIVIIGGAALGGLAVLLAVLHFTGTHQPGLDIVIAALVGAFVASMAWDVANEECDQKPGDQKPGDQKPGDQKPGDQKPGDQEAR